MVQTEMEYRNPTPTRQGDKGSIPGLGYFISYKRSKDCKYLGLVVEESMKNLMNLFAAIFCGAIGVDLLVNGGILFGSFRFGYGNW